MKKMIWGEDPDFSGPYDWFRNSLILQEIRKRRISGSVLDFGCGSGNLIIRLASSGFEGIGVDASALAVKYLSEKLKAKGLTRKFKVMVGREQMLFRKGMEKQFDLVVCGETLEHLKDDWRAIQGFHQVLKKRGICVVTAPAHPRYWDQSEEYAGHYRRYEERDLRALFERNGFVVETIFCWGFPVSLVWHRIVLLPLFTKKAEEGKIYSHSGTFFAELLSLQWLKRVFSYPFWIDQCFNWTRLGGGLLLVARKNHSASA